MTRVLQYLEIFSEVLSFYLSPLYESSDEHQEKPILIVFDVEKEVEVFFIRKAFEATQRGTRPRSIELCRSIQV
jgi:hypothetical protein